MARIAGASGASTTRATFAGVAAATTPEAMALWMLVGLELLAQIGLRQYFRRHHGG